MLEKNINKVAYILFATIMIIILIISLYQGNSSEVMMISNALILLTTPFLVESLFKIKLPTILKLLVYIFVFASIILGNIYSFYGKFTNWDNFLHLFSAFLITILGFGIINYLNKNKITILTSILFAFCFAVTFGVIWEFTEYTSDKFFKTDTQRDTIVQTINSTIIDNKDVPKTITIKKVAVNNQVWHYGGYIDIGLIDTMTDMFFNAVGSTLFCISIYFLKSKKVAFLIYKQEDK